MSLCNLCSNKDDKNARVGFSTYPTILNAIDRTKTPDGNPLYTPAHFDLIIIDESHRSIFKKYRAIFEYFDALLVGLTATPKSDVDHNTYEFFDLPNYAPTYVYEYLIAVERDKVLVPYHTAKVSTKFQRDGIKYNDLSKEDKERVRKFLFNFDYKKYFPIVVKNLMMSGKYFCWFREGKKDSGGAQKYALQMLPQNRCKITGYSNLGALFDIDLSFLLSGTVDLGLYDDIFGKYYKEIFKEENLNKYIPSNSLNKRDGSWAYWVQTSPKDGAWCFLFDESNFAGVSPMAPFLKDTILGAEIQKLQYDKDIATAH